MLQIAEYAYQFEALTRDNLASAIDSNWTGDRPDMMPMLLDGFLDNLDLMLPILEEQGFIGWLFISPLFFSTFPRPINAPMRRRIYCTRQSATDTGKRIALDWDEARAISARGHVFACHSRTHFESKPETPLDVLEDEIVSAKAEMEREFGVEVDCFCWLRGAPLGVNLNASTLLRVAGFRGLFSKFRIQAPQARRRSD